MDSVLGPEFVPGCAKVGVRYVPALLAAMPRILRTPISRPKKPAISADVAAGSGDAPPGAEMAFPPSRVTAPSRARSRPSTVAPEFIVMDAEARMFPSKEEPELSVAELPTCQKILSAWAPLISVI
jgi:hypothetical protein